MSKRNRSLYLIAGTAILATGTFYYARSGSPAAQHGAPAQHGVERHASNATDRPPPAASASERAPRPAPVPRLPDMAQPASDEAPPLEAEAHAAEPPPVVAAIRTRYTSPADKRRAMIDALERSGPSNEPWTRDASAVFGSWRDALPEVVARETALGAPRCFQGGCAVELTFASRDAYDAARARFRSFGPDLDSLGGRVQTPPEERTSGEILATWMFLRPEPSHP